MHCKILYAPQRRYYRAAKEELPDVAVLDVNVNGQLCYELADLLHMAPRGRATQPGKGAMLSGGGRPRLASAENG